MSTLLWMQRTAQKKWMNTDAKALGERIRKLRQEREWRQLDLANEADVERTSIANYEQGVCYPAIPVLRKLASALRVSLDELVNGASRPDQVLHDAKLLELFTRVAKLNYHQIGIVEEVIEGLLAKHEKDRAASRTPSV